LVLNERIWHNSDLQAKATKLLEGIEKGINEFGIITDSNGDRTYAYEVDGLGGALFPMDDANVPSLLSAPLLGWSKLDHDVYQATRKKILSSENPYYASGTAVRGIGSPHTGKGTVWPM
jgi:meiotically up-regulated gene 157 (Mug157) protein